MQEVGFRVEGDLTVENIIVGDQYVRAWTYWQRDRAVWYRRQGSVVL
jgi:hypothetical protein